MAGKNRALSSVRNKFSIYESAASRNKSRKCVFISHKYEDKAKAKIIGDYLMEILHLDIYFDENDEELQDAIKNNDNKRIALAINKGIEESTHILCLVSDATRSSWWVPYEIGYAKKKDNDIATLKLKGITSVPSYLKIETVLYNYIEFTEYYSKISSSKIGLLENYNFNSIKSILD